MSLKVGRRVHHAENFQHPLDAVYSDMGGYVDRADGLLAHKTPSEPRVLTIYPWGAHALLALEFLVLGRHARVALAIDAAFVGAVPAPCMAALSARLVPSRPVAAMVGVLVALWPPQVAFTGFFLSEIWFAAAIAGQAALTVQPSGPGPATRRPPASSRRSRMPASP